MPVPREPIGPRQAARPAVALIALGLLAAGAWYSWSTGTELRHAPAGAVRRAPAGLAGEAMASSRHIPTVPAEEAAGYVERLCAVWMRCGPASRGPDGSVVLQPDAGIGVPPFRAVLTPDAVRDFQAAEIDPLTFFSGMTVRVTGRVRDRCGRYEVIVPEIDRVEWADTPAGDRRTTESWAWDGKGD